MRHSQYFVFASVFIYIAFEIVMLILVFHFGDRGALWCFACAHTTNILNRSLRRSAVAAAWQLRGV